MSGTDEQTRLTCLSVWGHQQMFSFLCIVQFHSLLKWRRGDTHDHYVIVVIEECVCEREFGNPLSVLLYIPVTWCYKFTAVQLYFHCWALKMLFIRFTIFCYTIMIYDILIIVVSNIPILLWALDRRLLSLSEYLFYCLVLFILLAVSHPSSFNIFTSPGSMQNHWAVMYDLC